MKHRLAPRKAGSERAPARSEVTRAARASADRDRSGEGAVELVALGLEMATGPALILDRDLRIRAITEAARALLGFEIKLGTLAPKVLCGGAVKRPFAEALAAGQGATGTLPHPGSADPKRRIAVRSVALGGPALGGWLILLSDASDVDEEGPVLFHGMWTQSPKMKQVFRIVERVAADDMTVLIRGETGSGKELVAQAIHARSARSAGPFRAINCAALPGNLLESELFGHTRGAFTGAVRDTQGHIELAQGGTLFLDEVAELSLELQAKLLRVIETRTVIPVGGREPVAVDIRVVSATHRSLRKEVEAGRFRADLMYRLRVIPIFLPPLRERPEDISLLVDKRLLEMNGRSRRTIAQIAPAALTVLERYPFPGNVRELRNVLAYAYALGDGPVLVPSDLPSELLMGPRRDDPPSVRVEPDRPGSPQESPEVARLRRALERAAGSREKAARMLGISRVTLWRRLKRLGL